MFLTAMAASSRASPSCAATTQLFFCGKNAWRADRADCSPMGSSILGSRLKVPQGCDWCPSVKLRMQRYDGLRSFCSQRGRGGIHLHLRTDKRMSVSASAANIGAGNLDNVEQPAGEEEAKTEEKPSNVKAVAIVTGVALLLALGGIFATLSSGGPAALAAAIAKSGFMAGFGMIFATEIGDKTFFIAALLAMRYAKLPVLVGSTSALALMTVISVAIGRLFQKVPEQLQFTMPVGEWAAIALLVYFGVVSIKNAWEIPSETEAEAGENEELVGAEEMVSKVAAKKLMTSPWAVLLESFSVVFVAEWGDRSMLATICLAAAQEPVGVAVGAIGGHLLATFLAVLGGSLLSKYISEKAVGYAGGVLFLVFAVATFFHLY